MKTVFSNYSQVTHLWANQNQELARSSNVFFNGSLIYSYGNHFCMGRVVRLADTVVLTSRTYSNTTAQHLSAVRYSVNHYPKRVSCAYPQDEQLTERNIIAFKNEIFENREILSNTRKRPETKEGAKQSLGRIVSNFREYLEVLGVSEKKALQEFPHFVPFWNFALSLDLDQIAADIKKTDQKAERKRKADERKLQERYKQTVIDWIAGVYTRDLSFTDTVYLRYISRDDEKPAVQTSKGVEIPVKTAKTLFKLIQAGKDVIGHKIAGYTVISMNGVLKIGCHEITRDEINRFASLMGWGHLPNHA